MIDKNREWWEDWNFSYTIFNPPMYEIVLNINLLSWRVDEYYKQMQFYVNAYKGQTLADAGISVIEFYYTLWTDNSQHNDSFDYPDMGDGDPIAFNNQPKEAVQRMTTITRGSDENLGGTFAKTQLNGTPTYMNCRIDNIIILS